MATATDVVKKKKAIERKTLYSSNTDDVAVLQKIAEDKGYKLKKEKPSLFTRTIDVLSRPLYASAGAAKAVIKGENVAKEAWKGLKGQEKETYSDVLAEMGVKNKWVKGGVGLGLDIALDPSTYFGGTLIKGAGKAIGGAGKIVGRNYAKVAPESARLLTEGAKKMKEGITGAFSVYGGGKKKEIVDNAFRQLNKIAIEKENVIDDVVGRFAKNVDEKKLERAGEYVYNNRLIERGIKEGEIKWPQNKQTRELVTAIKRLGQDLGKKTGLKKTDEWYFPGMDETLLKKTSKEASPLKVGGEKYLKQFKGAVEESKRLKDVREAFGRRMFEVVRDNMNRQFLEDTISTYGIKKMSKKAAAEAGMVAVKDKNFGKTIGYLKQADAGFLNNILYPEMKAIDALAKGVGYDQVTNLFKTAVTAYFPAFHVRNYLSGMVQNYQVLGVRSLAPANIMSGLAVMKGSKSPLKFAKWSGSADDLKNVLVERFKGASRYISDIGDYIDDLGRNNFKLKPISNARKLGGFIEMNQKANATITALRKGHTLEEALNLAEKAGFDYSKITQFESKVMKRIIPFYTFARKNAQLQAETLLKNPERILNQAKFANALSNVFGEKMTEEDVSGLPDWALEGLGFKLKDGKYVSSLGLPLEEFIKRFNNPVMSSLTSLNPIIKYPLESELGYDFFREQQIIDIDKVAPATGKILMDAKKAGKLPAWFDNAINIQSYVSPYDGKEKYTMSPKALHILRNLPTSRFQNTLEKLFDKDLDKVNKFMAFFSGGKIYDIDVETQKFFKDRDMKREMQDWLQNRGIGETFESFYIKK